MSRILLIASLHRDRAIALDRPLLAGGRVAADGREVRLGGGGANTGIGLVRAGHEVRVACTVDDTAAGDWILDAARGHGLTLDLVARRPGGSAELLLLISPDGTRTILTIDAPPPYLPPAESLAHDPACLYVNSASAEVAELMATSLDRRLVVGQWPRLPRSGRQTTRWPAHILVASESDLPAEAAAKPYEAGRALAGDALRWMVVTRGEWGAVAYGATETITVPAAPAQVVDTTGAGDVYVAGLIDGLVTGDDMAEALGRAARWAALAVATWGSIPPDTVGRCR
ncbi:MAG TPA: PfkB family carbohydrate kinase [Stellaceae bacterium]|nr:PfkB family carbohydrate kinase [Stellaceae bacterium]